MYTRIVDADLSEHPPIDEGHLPHEVILGDLHGNALKLIYALIAENVIALEKPIEDYKRLHEIYTDPIWDEEKLDKRVKPRLKEFKEILSRASVRPDFASLLLIGDELADRGSNDLLTLYVFDIIFPKIKKQNPKAKIEALYSNHTADAITAQIPDNQTTLPAKLHVDPKQKRSYLNYVKLANFLEDENSDFAETLYRLFIEHVSRLKLIDYKKDPSTHPPTFYLITHAPIGLETVKGLADIFKVKYEEKTMDDLGETIDRINQAYRAAPFSYDASFPAIKNLIWRRNKDGHPIDLPALPVDGVRNYGLVGIHGHEGKKMNQAVLQSQQHNMVNLDSTRLGQITEEGKMITRGDHLSLVCKPPAPAAQLAADKKDDLTLEIEPFSLAASSNLSLSIAPATATSTPAVQVRRIASQLRPVVSAADARIRIELKAQEKKVALENAIDELLKIIDMYKEINKSSNCFSLFLSDTASELKAAQKFLVYYRQIHKLPGAPTKVIDQFSSDDIKHLTNPKTKLGNVIQIIYHHDKKNLGAFQSAFLKFDQEQQKKKLKKNKVAPDIYADNKSSPKKG